MKLRTQQHLLLLVILVCFFLGKGSHASEDSWSGKFYSAYQKYLHIEPLTMPEVQRYHGLLKLADLEIMGSPAEKKASHKNLVDNGG